MTTVENKQYSTDYLDPEKRSIANAVQVFYKDGTHSEKIAVEYPIGHRRRRNEGIPLLKEKFINNLKTRFPAGQAERINALLNDPRQLSGTPVPDFMELFVI